MRCAPYVLRPPVPAKSRTASSGAFSGLNTTTGNIIIRSAARTLTTALTHLVPSLPRLSLWVEPDVVDAMPTDALESLGVTAVTPIPMPPCAADCVLLSDIYVSSSSLGLITTSVGAMVPIFISTFSFFAVSSLTPFDTTLCHTSFCDGLSP